MGLIFIEMSCNWTSVLLMKILCSVMCFKGTGCLAYFYFTTRTMKYIWKAWQHPSGCQKQLWRTIKQMWSTFLLFGYVHYMQLYICIVCQPCFFVNFDDIQSQGSWVYYTHCPPPEGICIGVEVWVDVFLCQVHEEGGKDQDQETYVPSGNQLLRES